MKQTPFQTFRYVHDNEETGSTLCFVGSDEELAPVFNAVLGYLERTEQLPDDGLIGYSIEDYRRRDWPKGYAPKDRVKRSVFMLTLPSSMGLRFVCALHAADQSNSMVQPILATG